MPVRSNDFQRLVYLLKKQFEGTATVTESKLLLDRVTGTLREVDISIESSVVGHPVLASIECCDHQRPADVEWVDRMIGKHRRLPTDVLILASRSGFTRQARNVAEKSGVQILTYEELQESKSGSLLKLGRVLWGKISDLSIGKVIAVTAALDGIPSERVRLLPDNNIVGPGGSYLGMARDFVQVVLRSPRVSEQLAREGEEKHKSFTVEWAIPRRVDGQRLCLQKIAPPAVVPIERMEIMGSCRVSLAEFRMNPGKLGEVPISWGTADLVGASAMILLVADTEDQIRVTFDLRPLPKRGRAPSANATANTVKPKRNSPRSRRRRG